MGEASPFEPFMLVSSYKVIAVASSPTGTISWPDAIVLSVGSEELGLDDELDWSLTLQTKLQPQLNVVLTLTCLKLLCLPIVALKSLLYCSSVTMSKIYRFPPHRQQVCSILWKGLRALEHPQP